MENPQVATTKKIIKSCMYFNKLRNLFIIAAIALTALMITSVFSIGISYFESINTRKLRLEGSASHFAFYQPTQEQLDAVFNLDYVHYVGVAHTIGIISDDFVQLESALLGYVNKVQWDEMFTPTFTNIIGNYAENDNEVMISRHTLAKMGIPDPEIGMEIPIVFTHFNTGEKVSDVFILSEIFTDFSHMESSVSQPLGIFTSYNTAERFQANALENTSINIIFRDSNKILENVERLKLDLSIPAHNNQEYMIAPVFRGEYGSISTYIGFTAIMGLLMLAGYLLIYNVMYMSVSRDVRFYGLLKIIGMSSKQIRNVVVGQCLRLCVIGIPIGLLIASLVSFITIPIYVGASVETGAVVSFSPIIFIGGILFTTLTVYLASLAPSRKAAQLSPIDTIHFVEDNQPVKRYASRTNCNPLKMAMRNIFREPKRAKLTILSLFIGIAVFISSATLSTSLDIEHILDKQFQYEFVIVSSQRFGSLSWDFTNMTKSRFGDGAHISALIPGEFIYTDEISKHVDFISERDGLSRDEVISLLFDEYHFGLKSTDSRMLIEVTENALSPENLDAFERGEVAFFSIRGFINLIDDNWTLDEKRMNTFTVGSVLEMAVGPDKVPAQLIFGGFVDLKTPPIGWSTHAGTPEILVSNTFMAPLISHEHEENHKSADILSISLDSLAESEEYYYSLITSMLSAEETLISRISEREYYEEALFMIFVFGGSLAGILALIGIFNFINVMSVSTVTRRREFALLECIGMSKKQMRWMLRCEGIGFWIIAVLLSASAGSLIAYSLISFISTFDDAFRFIFPLTSVLAMYASLFTICLITPELTYRSMTKATIVERLREVE